MTYAERINLDPSTMTAAERQEHAQTLEVYAYEGENLADEVNDLAEAALKALKAGYPEEFPRPDPAAEAAALARIRSRGAAKRRN